MGRLPSCDTLIRNARVCDGSGAPPAPADVAVRGGMIAALGPDLAFTAPEMLDAGGLLLAPGFIDVHTHDDTAVIEEPAMLPKLSQGVTTVITGNCGISAAPVRLKGEPPDPMNLLGDAGAFRYPDFSSWIEAVNRARPAVNVAALVGHTSLRSNHMERLDREASAPECAAMRAELEDALARGALGLSTGLAYLAAQAATPREVHALVAPLSAAGAVYTTHMRSEAAAILEAIAEAAEAGRAGGVPVIVSHLKCAGVDNWGRSPEVLAALDRLRAAQPIAWDCYPYAAGSSTLDLRQVDERVPVTITWSRPHPEAGGRTLAEIAAAWGMPQIDAARSLQPAGAIYHSLSEEDMRRILRHPATMIGSDGLPCDPRPHPRLWGTFPRVLGRYARQQGLLSLAGAIHRMTGLPARWLGLSRRGLIRAGFHADLVLLDPEIVLDTATFEEPTRPAVGIEGVWVNGILSYHAGRGTGRRAGGFVARGLAGATGSGTPDPGTSDSEGETP